VDTGGIQDQTTYVSDYVMNLMGVKTRYFGASVSEMMWAQKRIKPDLPIPIFLIQLIKTIIDHNGLRTKDIFWSSCNQDKLEDMIRRLNSGEPIEFVAKGQDIKDFSSLLKAWFRDMGDAIIQEEKIDAMSDALRDHTEIEFAETVIPDFFSYILAYLVGFLQDVADHFEETNMDAAKLATVFAPNIARKIRVNYSDYVKKLLLVLIQTWDVSKVYPVNLN